MTRSMILGIDTSGTSLGLALAADGKSIAEKLSHPGLKHGEIIQNEIGRFLQENGFSFSDLTGISATIGPGSFTGVRIGLAAAKGYAYGLKIPLAGISTLAAMAQCLISNRSRVVTVIDAKRNEIYWAVFDCGFPQAVRLSEDNVSDLEALKELVELKPVFCVPSHLKSKFEERFNAVSYMVNDNLNLAVPAAIFGEDDIKNNKHLDLGTCAPLYLRH